MDVGVATLASFKFHFIRVNDKLVQDPSNNTSIDEWDPIACGHGYIL